MGVYIPNWEKPKSCDECWAEYAYEICNSHSDCCPLVPVALHGDLIDREPFIQFIKTHWDSYDQWVVEQLEARPTIIPAEEGKT